MAQQHSKLHATAVSIDAQGVLILGASGSGKSSLALELIALGAKLVSDDIVQLEDRSGVTFVVAPGPMPGLIEARGVGILHVPNVTAAPLALCVDMNASENARLPERRSISMLGNAITLLHTSTQTHFPSAILHHVKYGRHS